MDLLFLFSPLNLGGSCDYVIYQQIKEVQE